MDKSFPCLFAWFALHLNVSPNNGRTWADAYPHAFFTSDMTWDTQVIDD
jgi:hypothetical protein